MGKIMLTLRRPDEKDEVAGEQVTPIQDILSGRTKLATEPTTTAPTAAPSQGFKAFVEDANRDDSAEGTPVAWKMEVLTPSERKVFEWATDAKQLPTGETVLSSSSGSGSSPPPVAAPPSPRAPSGGSIPKSPPRSGDGAPPVTKDAS